MKRLVDLTAQEAKAHFLKGSSFFNGDFPDYISFEPILTAVSDVLGEGQYPEFKSSNPDLFSDVNYSFVTNKDGRFAWRPYELIHPAIYVSLVNLLCSRARRQLSQM
jgi:RNA-directed DNA polymerase